jgi:hypothetical protein
MSDVFSGGCLCGAVRYYCNSAPIASVHCQCADCRKNSGTGHGSKFGVPRSTLTLSGELKFYEASVQSGNVVRRGFCPNCGSPILAESSGHPDIVAIAAGSLDEPALFQPKIVLYASSAVPWDYIDPQLPKFDKMPQM